MNLHIHGKKYERNVSLLPFAPEELREIERVSINDMSEHASLTPLRHVPVPESMQELVHEKEFRGKITVCSCGEEGCGAEYAWIRDSVCIVLFKADEYLQEVSLYPFRIEVHT